MSLKEELEKYAADTVRSEWTDRKGAVVPKTDDLALKNDATELDATVLYADIVGSTSMVATTHRRIAAETYKLYLYSASKIIRDCGGSITAFDGDRIMAVFIGDSKNTSAADCALKIQWATLNIVNVHLKNQYEKRGLYTPLKQRVGIDTSSLYATRAGIRGSNDLVWVGNAANNAAKLAAIKGDYTTYITEPVYDLLNKSVKLANGEGENMWKDLGTAAMGYRIFGSTFNRSV